MLSFQVLLLSRGQTGFERHFVRPVDFGHPRSRSATNGQNRCVGGETEAVCSCSYLGQVQDPSPAEHIHILIHFIHGTGSREEEEDTPILRGGAGGKQAVRNIGGTLDGTQMVVCVG